MYSSIIYEFIYATAIYQFKYNQKNVISGSHLKNLKM